MLFMIPPVAPVGSFASRPRGDAGRAMKRIMLKFFSDLFPFPSSVEHEFVTIIPYVCGC